MEFTNTVPTQQIIKRLRFDNRWWEKSHISPHYYKMTRRVYFDLFSELVMRSVHRAVILLGPRRVGKTVMIYHMIEKLIESGVNPKKICYLSIETPIYNHLRLDEIFDLCMEAVGDNDPTGFYVFFDEIQYLKDWEIHLKTLVDSYLDTKFIVSGSAAAELKRRSAESGAGRFTEFILPPLTFHEYITLKKLEKEVETDDDSVIGVKAKSITKLNQHFFNYINYGGYPEVIFSEEIQKDPGRYIKNDIIDKVLTRDLPSLYGISDIQELNYLFNTLAYNTGNEVSLETLSKNSGVAKNTIKKYIAYLEAAFLIKVVYRIGLAKKYKRANFFKVYLTNPSLRCALFSPIEESDPMAGNLVETAIFSQWDHSPTTALNYARWENGEVDMVCLNKSTMKPRWAAEIKWSDRVVNSQKDVANLIKLQQAHRMNIRMICTTKTLSQSKVYGETNTLVFFEPSSLYCYIVGFNTVRNKEKALRDDIKREEAESRQQRLFP